jgi:Tol biopolymer transport system component
MRNIRRMRFRRRTHWRLHQLRNRPGRTFLVGGIAAALLGTAGATLLLLRSEPKRDFAPARPVVVPVLAPAQAVVAPILPPARAQPLSSVLAAELSRAEPHTILEAPSIEGFAQDGDRIVWIDGVAPCDKQVKIRRVCGGPARSLVAKRGPTCRGASIYFDYAALALAGTRALWEVTGAGNTVIYGSIRTASVGDRVEQEIFEVDDVDKETFTPVPAAGDGTTLACACPGSVFAFTPQVTRLGTGLGTTSLAVSGRRVALVGQMERGCACNSAPRWSPDGRRVIFTSTRGANERETALYSIRADGTGVERVSLPGEGVSGASFSPDGRFLLYERRRILGSPGGSEIIVASRDGTGGRLLAKGEDARWSPNGRFIAYAGYDVSSAAWSSFVVPARGGVPTRIGPRPSLGTPPAWSPDGTKIALAQDRSYARKGGLFVVDFKTRERRRILSGNGDNLLALEWSPDGTRIAFLTSASQLDKPSPAKLHVVRSDGSGHDIDVAEGGHRDFYSGALAWSPDSSMIAFSLGSWAYERPTIRIVTAAGGDSRELAPGRDPAWSPDGETLAYAAVPRISQQAEAQERAEIARIDRDGSSRLLTRTRPFPKRNAVEVRDAGTGRIVAAFNMATLPSAVALSGSHIALLVVKQGSRPTIEIRKLDGSPVRTIAASRPADDNIFMSGGWIVFKTGATSLRRGVTIRAVHVRSGGQAVLARTHAEVVGLSIDGNRVAWAERGERRSRIRALLLP